MGIRLTCPNGHKLNVKTFLAGKRGVCPQCGAKFAIPMTPDAPISDASQSSVVGESHSVEIISPTSSHTTSVAAAPSVIIAVADCSASPPILESDSVATHAPESVSSAIPPLPVADAPQPLVVTDSGPVTPEAKYVTRRERSRRKQLTITVVLLLLVIVLAVVLIWVLRRDVGQTNGGKVSAAAHNEFLQRRAAATAATS